MKRLIKLAVIRENEGDDQCPYSLPISYACNNVGEAIDQMYPLSHLDKDASDEEKENLKEANLRILSHNKTNTKCKYAAHLFKDKPNFVDCAFNETNESILPSATILGAPSYSQLLSSIGIDGLFSYPLGAFVEGTSRNLYYGIYEWASSKIDKIKKISLRKQILTDLSKK